MTHEDLERQLRAQRGPREDGYAPAGLPATLGTARESSPIARLARGGMLVGVAVAGALAVAVVGSLLTGHGPGVGTGGTSSAAPSTGGAACDSSAVTITAEPWGGAAGARGTNVTIALAAGQPACSLATSVKAQIADANGAALVSGSSTEAAGSVSLEPGGTFSIGIAWSNWCGSSPAVPVTLSLQLGGWPSAVPISVPAGGSPIPPCSGGSGTSLSVTQVQPGS